MTRDVQVYEALLVLASSVRNGELSKEAETTCLGSKTENKNRKPLETLVMKAEPDYKVSVCAGHWLYRVGEGEAPICASAVTMVVGCG